MTTTNSETINILDSDPQRDLIQHLAANPDKPVSPQIWEQLAEFTDGEEWRKLIVVRPEAADHCPWEKLDVCEWWPFFKYLPQYFEKCACPAEVPARAWAYLLCTRPELATQFDRWNDLTPAEWHSLLQRQPTLAEHCPCLEQAHAITSDDFSDGLTFPTGDSTTDFLADTDYLEYYADYGSTLIDKMIQELDNAEIPAGE
ncbi:MAG: hypothetical protein II943_07115 [Victivallales bacterium]|nr:hypothetical protein [Victivallales bacterium]